MLALCLGLALAGLAAFVMKDEHFVTGANLAIGVLTLVLLPVLQATQNRDGAALRAKIDCGGPETRWPGALALRQ